MITSITDPFYDGYSHLDLLLLQTAVSNYYEALTALVSRSREAVDASRPVNILEEDSNVRESGADGRRGVPKLERPRY